MFCFSLGMSAVLNHLEDFIRDKVVVEKWTHKKLSSYLQQIYPGKKGLSIRSLQRFCSDRDIHKTARIQCDDLDAAVEDAIEKVCVKLCKL